MPARLRPLLLLGLAIAGISAWFFFQPRLEEGVLRSSGTIEATKVDVAFQVPGRVQEILVNEGDAIDIGGAVARLSSEEIQARLNSIQASLDAVRSQVRQQESAVELRREVVANQVLQARGQEDASRFALDRLKEGTRPQEIRVAEATVAQTESDLIRRKNDLDRLTALFSRQAVSKAELDAVESAFRASDSAVTTARERLALAREGPRKEDVAEAEARLRSAEAGVGLALSGRREIDIQQQALAATRARERELAAQMEAVRAQFGYTQIKSPIRGVILLKNVEGGEIVNSGTPVVTVGDLENVWMNIYVPETQTGQIQLGQTVQVRVDAFPTETFEGKVTYISSQSEFTPKTIQTEEERVKLVFRVKVSIPNRDQRLKPGMPADAEIRLP